MQSITLSMYICIRTGQVGSHSPVAVTGELANDSANVHSSVGIGRYRVSTDLVLTL